MDQIVHIFRKDIRRHQWEIAVSIAILAGYAWNQSTQGIASGSPPDLRTILLGLLTPLAPVAWVILVVRVVQAECLVGDRQFWLTRPYEWKKLLAAKLLFVVAFVNIPLFVVQFILLIEAGFPPTSYFAGLLWLQVLWILFLVLPAGALAAVTAGVGRFTLVVLGLLVYLIAVASLSSSVPNAGVRVGSFPESIELVVAAGACVAAVLWQYARRRTAQSRVLLLCAAAAIPIIMFATPYQALIARTYPQAGRGRQLPVQLRFDPAKPSSHERGFPEKNKVHVRIPLLVSGIADGSAVFVAGTKVSIQGSEGLRWNSGWKGSVLPLEANHPSAHTDITIDKAFFEQVKSNPANVHISFALAVVHAGEARRLITKSGQFALPGGGRCSFSSTTPSAMVCCFPLKRPFLLISAKSDQITCAPQGNETPLPSGTIGYGWIWSADRMPAEFGLNPVDSTPLYVSDWGKVGSGDFRTRGVCPGTPLTVFTAWKKTQRGRIELDIQAIRLAAYQLNDSSRGTDGVGIFVH